MLITFFFFGVVIFLISILLCNIIFKVFQKIFFKTQYKFTVKFRYFLSCLVMFILGIAGGKFIIAKII